MSLSHLFLIAILLQAPQPTPVLKPTTITAGEQREGLRVAIESLKSQIKELSVAAGREVILTDPSSPALLDQQSAVIKLADAMDGNSLLSRSYLALAAAELKYVTLPCCVNSFPPGERKKILYHIEAIKYAIDDNVLEKEDLRVLRGVEAGISQAIREESGLLQSSQTLIVSSRRLRRHGALTLPRCGRCQ
ncbi:MAG: hypothetical protein JWP89_5181 [Schlesneria sp.]|nr:hypothetical protein [Schlesneria sp.]